MHSSDPLKQFLHTNLIGPSVWFCFPAIHPSGQDLRYHGDTKRDGEQSAETEKNYENYFQYRAVFTNWLYFGVS